MKRRFVVKILLPGLVLCWLLPARPSNGQASQPTNLLPNASFEEQADGKPAEWGTQTWGGKGVFTYAETGRTGERCVMIVSEQGADIGWRTTVSVTPHSTYRLSGWMQRRKYWPS